MKKCFLMLIIILMTLFGCESELNTSLYISSIGFECVDNNMVMYFLCNPLNDIIRSDDKELKIEYFTIEANTVAEGFEKVEETIPFKINFMHLQTVIFHESFILADKLTMFFDFMLDARIVTYNFYCFLSQKPIKDIFEYESPNTISFQHSLLSSPSSAPYEDYGCRGMHFLTFANNYFDRKRYLHIPVIDIRKTLNDKSVLTISGFGSITTKLIFFNLEDYVAMNYLYEQDFIFYETEKKTYEFRNYRFFYDVINGVFTFTARVNVPNLANEEKKALRQNLTNDFRQFFDEYILKQGSLYFIEEYNYINKKALDVQKYEIIILI